MAAKPPATPRWANVGGTIVEPPSGKKDIGWEAGESPPEGYFNWFQNLDWQWLEYLRDGRFRGPIRISEDDDPVPPFWNTPGTLMVGDMLSVSNLAEFNGNIFGGADFEIQGDGVIGEALEVGSDLDVGGAITAENQIAGLEVTHTAIRELQLSAAAGIANTRVGGIFWDRNNKAWGNFDADPDIVDFPIPLHARCVIHRFAVNYLTGGAGTRTFRLMRRLGTSLGALRTVTSSTTGHSVRTFSVTPMFLDPGATFSLECQILGGDAIHGISIFYAYPFQIGVGSEVP